MEESKDLGIESGGQDVRGAVPLFCAWRSPAEPWLVAAGEPLTELLWSMEPFTCMGDARHLANTQEAKALERYGEMRERYSDDPVVNAVAVLHRIRDSDLGLWLRGDGPEVAWEDPAGDRGSGRPVDPGQRRPLVPGEPR